MKKSHSSTDAKHPEKANLLKERDECLPGLREETESDRVSMGSLVCDENVLRLGAGRTTL